jgi:hypothetical protein
VPLRENRRRPSKATGRANRQGNSLNVSFIAPIY